MALSPQRGQPMKNSKPETHSAQTRRRQLMQWLYITGGVMTPGGMIPTTVFTVADSEACEIFKNRRRQ